MNASAKRALRIGAIRTAAIRLAVARGRGLVLVYHRITRGSDQGSGIIPTLPETLFRRQLEALVEIGEVVPLEVLSRAPSAGRRPRFAITLDDDYITHHDVALPILQGLGVSATFFLCGRSLHGLQAPWFEVLDLMVRRRGFPETRRLIGSEARTLEELAVACERSPDLQRAVLDHGRSPAEPGELTQSHIAAVAEAGMTIGFHTIQHRLLPLLDDGSLEREVVEGREALERASSQAISLFAYPHGKAEGRTARAVRAAGYRAAVTGRPDPTTRRSNPFLLGRWEPRALEIHDFLVGLATKLNR